MRAEGIALFVVCRDIGNARKRVRHLLTTMRHIANTGEVLYKHSDKLYKIYQEELIMSELQKIRIRLKAYDHALLDKSAAKIVETAKKTGADVSGPIPLPTEKEVVTIIRAVHKYKDSREQFEQRTHKRLIDVTNATNKTVEALQKLDAPAGVDIYVKL